MIWPAISCQLLLLLPFPSAATPQAHSRKDLFTVLRCSGKSLYETSPPTPRVTRAPLSPLVWSRDTSWAALSYMSLYVGHAPAITHILKGRQRKIGREKERDGWPIGIWSPYNDPLMRVSGFPDMMRWQWVVKQTGRPLNTRAAHTHKNLEQNTDCCLL